MTIRGGSRYGWKNNVIVRALAGSALLTAALCLQLRAATWTVSTTADSGPGSLRQAILDANASPGFDTIQFQIPGDGIQIIALTSPLPALTDPAAINGFTQPGHWDSPIIELDGSAAGNNAGLRLLCGGCTVRDLILVRFGGCGIEIEGPGTNVVQGNYIGTDGYLDLGNGLEGVWVYNSSGNTIGGNWSNDGNLISCNGDAGIYILNGEDNFVLGNLVGTVAPGNGNNGLTLYNSTNNIIGCGEPGCHNVFSGNRGSGIYLYGSGATGNRIAGNCIGASLDRSHAVPNAGDGVTLEDANANLIGLTGEGNWISGNAQSGITLNRACNNLLSGNKIGLGDRSQLPLGNGYSGITLVQSTNNLIGGLSPGPGNFVSANKRDGIFIATNSTANVVQGNVIGLDLTGTNRLGNALNGIAVSASSGNSIGGEAPGAGNVISGNTNNGIYFASDAPGNTIEGNFIGCGFGGSNALPNKLSGVRLDSAANRVGSSAAPNTLSGNGDYGVLLNGSLARSNIVQGNRVGSSGAGTDRLGNGSAGVGILDAPGNLIGGPGLHEGNLISANADAGIYLLNAGACGNRIEGNLLGTDITGRVALGNSMEGIYVVGANSNTIAGAANVISGNATRGVFLTNAVGNVIFGNLIGTALDGQSPLGNGFHNIDCESGTTATLICSNRIAFAGSIYAGVRVRPGSIGNRILSNAIFSNGALGIDLGPVGMTPNDLADPDTGANNLQNFPMLVEAFAGSGVALSGALNSTPLTTFTLQFFASPAADSSQYGEGSRYLGETTVNTDARGDSSFIAAFPISVPSGYALTATATAPDGNTSEFSASITLSPGPQLALLSGAGGMRLTWHESGTHFRLQRADTLTPPVKWMPVSETPAPVNGQLALALPHDAPSGFYRLVYE